MSTDTRNFKEEYGKTIVYQLLSWYFDTARSLSRVYATLGMLSDLRIPDQETLEEMDMLLWEARGSFALLKRSLFIATDAGTVKDFEIYLEKALQRRDRRVIPRNLHGRIRSYLAGRQALEDRYEALMLQLDDVRYVYATHKWFDLRPEINMAEPTKWR